MQMEARGLGILGREVSVALPHIGAGLEAGRVFEVKTGGIGAGLVLEVVSEEFCFNLGAIFPADGLGVVEIAEMARRRGPVAVTPGAEDEEVLVVCVVRFESGVLDLGPKHIFLVVVAADGEGWHCDLVERVLDAT